MIKHVIVQTVVGSPSSSFSRPSISLACSPARQVSEIRSPSNHDGEDTGGDDDTKYYKDDDGGDDTDDYNSDHVATFVDWKLWERRTIPRHI